MSRTGLVPSRRQMIASTLAMAALPLTGVAPSGADAPSEILHPATSPAAAKDRLRGLKIGIATYSFRKLPLDVTIAGVRRVDLHYVSIKDSHIALNSTTAQRKAVAAQFKDAGITPLSCGVINLKNDEANIRQAFEYARDLGIPTINCHPDPASMSLLDKFVKEFDIKIAIHNHGPEAPHFKSPYDGWKAVQDHDPRLGLCIDVGHTARAGFDPAEAITKCATRLYDVHFKDISDAKARSAAAEVEVGRGVLDVKSMLQALIDIKFAGQVGFEHERTAENPLPGIAESVGYTKGILARI